MAFAFMEVFAMLAGRNDSQIVPRMRNHRTVNGANAAGAARDGAGGRNCISRQADGGRFCQPSGRRLPPCRRMLDGTRQYNEDV
jgi:hypothetical protein